MLFRIVAGSSFPREEATPVAAQSPAAMARLTSGPAAAMTSSWKGVSGFFSIRETPPIGRSVMSRTPMPKAFAARACPSS